MDSDSHSEPGGGHPADKLILDKASKRSRDWSPSKPMEPEVFTFNAKRKSPEQIKHPSTKNSKKRARSRSSSESLDIIDESMNKRAKHEPISLNLVASGELHVSSRPSTNFSISP